MSLLSHIKKLTLKESSDKRLVNVTKNICLNTYAGNEIT